MIGKDGFPARLRLVIGNPAIHNGPAWLTIQFIAQEPQINVIEGKWQRHSYPIHAGGNFHRSSLCH